LIFDLPPNPLLVFKWFFFSGLSDGIGLGLPLLFKLATPRQAILNRFRPPFPAFFFFSFDIVDHVPKAATIPIFIEDHRASRTLQMIFYSARNSPHPRIFFLRFFSRFYKIKGPFNFGRLAHHHVNDTFYPPFPPFPLAFFSRWMPARALCRRVLLLPFDPVF